MQKVIARILRTFEKYSILFGVGELERWIGTITALDGVVKLKKVSNAQLLSSKVMLSEPPRSGSLSAGIQTAALQSAEGAG
jgi:hypothetical protein